MNDLCHSERVFLCSDPLQALHVQEGLLKVSNLQNFHKAFKSPIPAWKNFPMPFYKEQFEKVSQILRVFKKSLKFLSLHGRFVPKRKSVFISRPFTGFTSTRRSSKSLWFIEDFTKIVKVPSLHGRTFPCHFIRKKI